jgi:hypothetical protein
MMPGPDKSQVDRKQMLALSGNIFSEQKGLEIEMVNEFSESLKTDPAFFEGFRVIKTGSVSRKDYFGLPIMSFELTCFSEVVED